MAKRKQRSKVIKADSDDLRQRVRHEFVFTDGPLKGTYYSRREHGYWCLPDVPRERLFPLTDSMKVATQWLVYTTACQGRSKHKRGTSFHLKSVVQVPKQEDWLFNTHGIVAASKSSIKRGDFDFYENPY